MKTKKVYALGFFDGVHIGHQTLLEQCRQLAWDLDAIPAAITFDRHPQSLFLPDPPPLLNTNQDRQTLLRHYGMELVHSIPVTRENMAQPWQDFLEGLVADGAIGFVCGYDFRFGQKGEGNAEKLEDFCRQHDLSFIIVPEIIMDGQRISSSRIRMLIESGDMDTAVKYLGHPHIFSGEVVPGKQLGRTLGIPTANLCLPEGIVCPKFGVYACLAQVEGAFYRAVTNVGIRPTVSGAGITVEPWILDFSGDLYGKTITLRFCHFLRPEKKFDSLEALKAEILRNAQQTRELL